MRTVRDDEMVKARGHAVVAAALALVFGAFGVRSLAGQSDRPRFDVVSVKSTPSEVQGFGGLEFLPGGVVRGDRVPLFLLINTAYDLSWTQLDSESDLLDERFVIAARAHASAIAQE